jgi:hypothetical protein
VLYASRSTWLGIVSAVRARWRLVVGGGPVHGLYRCRGRRAAPLSGYRTRRLPGGGAVSRVSGILAKGCLRKQLRRGTIGGSRCGNRLVECPLSAEVGQFYAHSPHLEAGMCIFGRESASRVCAIIADRGIPTSMEVRIDPVLQIRAVAGPSNRCRRAAGCSRAPRYRPREPSHSARLAIAAMSGRGRRSGPRDGARPSGPGAPSRRTSACPCRCWSSRGNAATARPKSRPIAGCRRSGRTSRSTARAWRVRRRRRRAAPPPASCRCRWRVCRRRRRGVAVKRLEGGADVSRDGDGRGQAHALRSASTSASHAVTWFQLTERTIPPLAQRALVAWFPISPVESRPDHQTYAHSPTQRVLVQQRG